MYSISYDSFRIYHPLYETEGYTLRDSKTHLAVNEPGTLDFTLDPDHPMIDQLKVLKGIVTLRSGDTVIYRGRIINVSRDFDLAKTFETEGLLACLNDSVIPPYSFPKDYEEDADYIAAAESGNVVAFWLGKLLAIHNAAVTNEQKIKLGVVTVNDPNNYIARESADFMPTWNVIQEKLVGTLGGYLLPRYEADGVYLDYYADLPLTNTQTVEFGFNLIDLVTESDATEIYTAIVPLGADGLTITELPDGPLGNGLVKEGATIYSTEGVQTYGRITRVEKWDDVTVVENLRSKAATKLLSVLALPASITVKAADLHGSEEDVANFRVGRYTRLKSAPHGFSALWPLMELDPDILDPGNTDITFGQTIRSQADILRARSAEQAEKVDKQQLELNQQQRSIEDLIATTEESITTVLQTAEEFIVTALQNFVATGDFAEFRQSVEAQLAVLSNEVNIQLTTTVEHLETIGDDLNSKYEEFIKYFRFTDSGLYIGEEGNAVLLRLDNDVMQFIRENVPELYLDNQGIHAETLEARQMLQIGNFAWTVENDGRVSFRKVT